MGNGWYQVSGTNKNLFFCNHFHLVRGEKHWRCPQLGRDFRYILNLRVHAQEHNVLCRWKVGWNPPWSPLLTSLKVIIVSNPKTKYSPFFIQEISTRVYFTIILIYSVSGTNLKLLLIRKYLFFLLILWKHHMNGALHVCILFLLSLGFYVICCWRQ